MKKSNIELQKLRDKIKEVNALFFNVLGGMESLEYRAKLNDISNNIYEIQKKNRNLGDDTIQYL